MTAAFVALHYRNVESLTLVAVDDVLEIKNNDNRTLMDLAVKYDYPECIAVLKSASTWKYRRVFILCIMFCGLDDILRTDSLRTKDRYSKDKHWLVDRRVVRRLGNIMSSYVGGMIVRFI